MRNSGNKILWQNIFEYSVNAKKAKKEEYILDKLKANSEIVELNEINNYSKCKWIKFLKI